PEGQRALNGPRQLYRELPPDLIGKLTYLIYGDRIAFVLWAKKHVIIMRNLLIVETFRQQFNFLWRIGKPVVSDG
ncbi:hypothetical protein, partial [Shewanella algae]|uniref:hypothetical protein n=1 Tax=Shewanella algae TaxID=38313 RepID=UPI00313E1266